MNPARSSDMKRHLWPPRVMGQPEGSTVVRGGEGPRVMGQPEGSTVVRGGEGYGEEW